MAQRGLVVSSPAACARAAATLQHATPRDDAASTQALVPLHAQRLPTPEAAPEALAAVAQRGQDHHVDSSHLTAHPRAAGHGRPTPRTPRQARAGHIQAHVRPADEVMGDHPHVQACLVLGTTSRASAVSAPAVLAADNSQSRVAGGLRLLQDPRLFGSAVFVNKPSRMAGLVMVMPLAWRVYAVTPRRLRQH